MKTKIIPILVFLLCLSLANAISFYSGNVIIKSFKADIDIQQNANVVLNYTLSGNEKVNLNFNNAPESAQITINGQSYGRNFDLEVNGDVSIIVSYSLSTGQETTKQFEINPNILFEGMVNSDRINSYAVKIKMPSNVNELLSSSDKAAKIEIEDGRKAFFWEKTDAYASTLAISWHTLNINIDVERIVPGEITEVFAVKNVIKNNGADISNVKLVQSFLESDFDPVAPLEEFERVQSGNDRRLEWKKEVSSIPSGSVNEFSYRLKVLNRGQNVLFRPLYVYADNALVKIIEKAEYTTAGIEQASSNLTTEQASKLPKLSTIEQIIPKPDTIPDIDEISKVAQEKRLKPDPQEEVKEKEAIAVSKASQIFKKKRTYVWAISIIMLLLVILLFIFLNRRKEEGIRF